MERFIQLTPLQRFKLTNFNLIDILGKGASGCVYKHIQDNNSYAVKVLNIEDWASGRAAPRRRRRRRSIL